MILIDFNNMSDSDQGEYQQLGMLKLWHIKLPIGEFIYKHVLYLFGWYLKKV